MEKKTNDQNGQDRERDQDLNANSAYSGSGAVQPGGNAGEAGKLSDFPDGNLDEEDSNTDSIPGNQTDQPTVGKSIDEATDPSKLSEL